MRQVIRENPNTFPPAGAMGVRTIHQAEAKAQLLVRVSGGGPGAAASQSGGAGNADSGDEAETLDAWMEGATGGTELKVRCPVLC